ncbi:DUF1799 domain-containing protein [Neisseria musculi]|uniref:DUF1799 domain-containing protein n=1 Tax=Neisseria musculi TaxID=1815583 RepID=A0A7H1M9Y1_9NEIS|nr:DUF1799 domain-containing protein [Neisseria musculi]QNT58446.1 hypothetical protein H7A79_1620 [Neisseria musculi]
MRAFGLTAADFTEEQVEVWPCNRRAVELFIAVSTQWRVGFSGAYGLDYGAVAAVMDMQGIKRKSRRSLLRKIRLMEREVLSMWAERENGK